MKRFLFLLACLLAITPLHADEAGDRAAIVQRGHLMIDGTLKGDMGVVLKFMHPETVKMVGGEEALKKIIGGVAQQMKDIGLEFVSMEVRPPARFYSRGQKTFAIATTTTLMQIPAKVRMTEEGSMIAVRDTPGGEWTFVRVSAQLAADRTLLKRILPDFPDDLTLEPPTKPVPEPLNK